MKQSMHKRTMPLLKECHAGQWVVQRMLLSEDMLRA
jgi:hypothetical protein